MKQAEGKKRTRPKQSVSFQDVARLAKVSTATVSRVARGNASVNEHTELCIRDAAEQLGLRLEDSPHDRLSTIAFLVRNRDVHHTFQSLVLLGAEPYCAANERELLFVSFRYPTDAPATHLHLPPALTSVREFPEQLGQHLAELTMRSLKDPLAPRKQTTIPTKLVARQSTAAPRKGTA